jgi:predicted lipid-binding transport protein (Tim44 family)
VYAIGFFDLLFQVFHLAIFVVSLYALIEAARTPAPAFPAMDKQTKGLWVGLLSASTLVSLAAVAGMFVFLTILALAVSLIFLIDVRPAVRQIGRSGSDGPYGPW